MGTKPLLGDGPTSIALRLHTYGFGEDVFCSTGGVCRATARLYVAAAQLNYHFGESPRFDPFVGAGVGYATASAHDEGGASASASTGGYLIAELGARMAINGSLDAVGGIILGTRPSTGRLRLGLAVSP
ncbi:MAG: hypothetical protein U9Q74_12195 [Gemmatimonadota bacterium]|nr:hypothetical protein [Gemmatimonadota bacterium]